MKILTEPRASKKLNPKQRITHKQILFCKYYVSPLYGFNGTKAAIAAGYSPRTARQQASRLLTMPVINRYRYSLVNNRGYNPPLSPEPKPKRQRRNGKQVDFMFNYVFLNGNGTQAAIKVGYSPKTAKHAACRLLKHPEIKAYVDRTMGERKSLGEIDMGRIPGVTYCDRSGG